MPRILVVTPFRNEEAAIPLYLEGLKNLDYPPDLIQAYWVENDSTDRTLQDLEEARPGMPFRTSLESVNIIGPQAKKAPGQYVKDVPYGGGRVKPWLVLWNRYFIPMAKRTGADYFLLYMADCVAPPHIVKAYLEVFETKQDAGWVGGVMHRRHPLQDKLFSPWPLGSVEPHLGTPPSKGLSYQLPGDVAEVKMASPHCCMIPIYALMEGVEASERFEWDVHTSVLNCLKAKGLKCYYRRNVYLKHVSSDGRIYRESLVVT